ncbi:VOC family protein [Actinomadura rubrisoli]|uniref:VOC family protein n=1 Tax=Actinomadura rubrisoli TaxID=2530368 RepID=A0A4V2YZ60_9ACTN|nr:VOC family protein [Actinomadura rubrisoli]TDD95867.1 VOC family protein [Actinomadura rubrisoli]
MTHVTSNAPTGTPTWLDLGIPDIERAKTFYGTLFGWQFEDGGPETGNYNLCMLRGEPVAGMMQHADPQATEFWWNLYFAADDCDGVVKRATDAGGAVVETPMDVMDLGRMAILKDPQGGQFGLWQGRAHIGSRFVNEPGSLVWNDLITPRADEARAFYTAVFEYGLEPVPGMDYTALRRPDGQYIGGINGEPDAPAPSWISYFDVADADEAVRRVRAGGGTVDAEPAETPYGRIASVRDPFGVPFRVMKTAPTPGS